MFRKPRYWNYKNGSSKKRISKNKFWKKLENLVTKNNIVLIFDECTTGFRQTFGGIYKMFNVKPDILVLGKALVMDMLLLQF